jgi:hypothetical protein
MNVFFDVQGTIISSGVSRPRVRESFAGLTEMGQHQGTKQGFVLSPR